MELQNLINCIYNCDLIMARLVSFVPVKDRLNLELACRRLYNLSKNNPCVYNEDFYLAVLKSGDSLEEFKLVLKSGLHLPWEYNAATAFAENSSTCSREELDNALSFYSRRFRYEIKGIYWYSHVDSRVLRLINKHFKYITGLFFKSYDETDCYAYLNSNEQSLTKRIKEIGFPYFDVSSCFRMIRLFKNLRKFRYDPSPEENLESLPEFLNSITNFNEERKQKIRTYDQRFTSSLELSLQYGFIPFIITPLASFSNLTDLVLSFEKVELSYGSSSIVSFFRVFDIHQLNSFGLSNLLLTEELVNLMKYTGSSKIENFFIMIQKSSNANFQLSSIIPTTVKYLNLDGDTVFEDLVDISERCSFLEYFRFYPTSRFPYYQVREIRFFPQILKSCKKLKLLYTNLPFDGQFLIDLLRSETMLTSAKFYVTGVNGKALREIYFKLYGKTLSEFTTADGRIVPGYYLMNLTFPIDSKIMDGIDLSSIKLSFFRNLYEAMRDIAILA